MLIPEAWAASGAAFVTKKSIHSTPLPPQSHKSSSRPRNSLLALSAVQGSQKCNLKTNLLIKNYYHEATELDNQFVEGELAAFSSSTAVHPLLWWMLPSHFIYGVLQTWDEIICQGVAPWLWCFRDLWFGAWKSVSNPSTASVCLWERFTY